MPTIQELVEFSREQRWLADGVPERDVDFSRHCGMDAGDVQAFREASAHRYLIVVRCPRAVARPWHGVLPPKPMWLKRKSSEVTGTVVEKGLYMFVSDYDLMSVWLRDGTGWRKLFMGKERPWSAEAEAFLETMNARLESELQHGCQDDYHTEHHPNVKGNDHFAAFVDGLARYLADPAACARFYAAHGLDWPYDATGHYTGPSA
jgi:hypothetical protein